MSVAVKSQEYDKREYPDNFDEEDIIMYDKYFIQCKLLYPKLDEFIINLSLIAFINQERGRGVKLDEEQALRIKELYHNNIKSVYESPKRTDEEYEKMRQEEEEKRKTVEEDAQEYYKKRDELIKLFEEQNKIKE